MNPDRGGSVIGGFLDTDRALYLIDGIYYDKKSDKRLVKKFGLLLKTLGEYANPKTRRYSEIAQFFTIVQPGLIMAKHIFEGVERNMFADESPDAGDSILTYSWKPPFDWEWTSEGRFDAPIRKPAPPNCVFVAIISLNLKHVNKYPDVIGWIDKWHWVEEDAMLDDAPVDWVERFRSKLWSAKS